MTFVSEGFRLRGTLHLPKCLHPPVVIGSHGLFSSSRSPKQIALAQKCCDSGLGFFRFDHRGCGESEGNFRQVTSLAGRCMDLLKAIETVHSYENTGRSIGLFGSSFGGAVCLSAAACRPIDAMVTFAAPVNSSSILKVTEKSQIPAFFSLPEFKRNFRFEISNRLKSTHHILIFHGEADKVVPISHAHEIFKRAAEPKKMIRQKDGDHRMSAQIDQQTFLRESVRWFKTWLNANPRMP